MVTLALHLIGVMDFQGRQWVLWSAPWPLLIWCLDWAPCGLLEDTGGVSMRSWCRKQLHNLFRQGSLGAPLPLPSLLFSLTCYPGLVGSCRQALERRVLPFKPPSQMSPSFTENCLSTTRVCTHTHSHTHTPSLRRARGHAPSLPPLPLPLHPGQMAN